MRVAVRDRCRKHGVRRMDARHALRQSIRVWEVEEGMLMHIGPSTTGVLLEVGVVADDDGWRIVHAMVARAKSLPGE